MQLELLNEQGQADVEGRRARHRVRPRLQRSAGAPDRRRLPGQRPPGHARPEGPRRGQALDQEAVAPEGHRPRPRRHDLARRCGAAAAGSSRTCPTRTSRRRSTGRCTAPAWRRSSRSSRAKAAWPWSTRSTVDAPKTKLLAAQVQGDGPRLACWSSPTKSTRTCTWPRATCANVLVVEPRYADPLSLVHYKKVLVTKGAVEQARGDVRMSRMNPTPATQVRRRPPDDGAGRADRVREGHAASPRSHNQVTVQGAARRDQARDQGRGRADVQGRRSRRVSGGQRQGQDQALRPLHRPPRQRAKKAYVRLKPGQELNFVAGRPRNHGRHQSQADFAGPPRAWSRSSHDAPAQGRAARAAARAADPEAPAATTTATSPRATRAAATSSTTAWSTSSATRTASRRRSSASSTTRTARAHIALLLLRRRRAPLHHRAARASKSGDAADVRRAKRRSSPATRCRCATSRSARPMHCIEMKPGKGAQIARSAGASRAAAGARRRLRAAAPALGRDAQGARRLPRHHRRSRQRRAQPAPARQGRRASAGAASARRCAAWR